MALDRQEAKAEIDVLNVPSVSNTDNGVMLKNNILDNVVFRKDEKSSSSGVGLTVFLADFTNDEQVILTGINQNIAFSFTGLEDGDVRFLIITKNAANIVSFAGALDMVQNRKYINSVATAVIYRITSKNGVIYVDDVFAPPATSFISITLATGWTGSAKYRINHFSGKIEYEIIVTPDGTAGITLFVAPTSLRPDRGLFFVGTLDLLTPSSFASIRLSSSSDSVVIDPAQLVVGDAIVATFEYYKSLP